MPPISKAFDNVLAELSLASNLAIFIASASVVWYAGTHLARLADAIAEKTGIGRLFLGMILLGGVTSLPELAVAVTATLSGVPILSVNDVIGSAAINVLILALADAVLGRDALTSTIASPGLLLQGLLGILLFAIVCAAALVGDRLFAGVGLWSWALLAAYALSLWLIVKTGDRKAWVPAVAQRRKGKVAAKSTTLPLRSLSVRTVAAAMAILVAGFFLAQSAASLAEKTALGASFFGAIFLAASTSLPEVSTVVAAVRLRRYEMAISDVFGTNLFNVTILVLVDALHTGGPILSEAGAFAGFAALLTIVLSTLFLVGMVERRDRTILRMGIDSLAAIGCYAIGVAVLYQLR